MVSKDIYLAKNEDGQVKIGISNAPDERVQSIHEQSERDVSLLHTIETESPHRHERTIHDIYDEHRVDGEWFDLPQSDIDTLSKMASLDELSSPDLRNIVEHDLV